jgi:hypothetical protein
LWSTRSRCFVGCFATSGLFVIGSAQWKRMESTFSLRWLHRSARRPAVQFQQDD